MSCCGRRRAPIDVRPAGRPAPLAGAAAAPPAQAVVAFVYTGATRLVAEGAATRRRYRFEHPGVLVEVDARDAPSLAGVPGLRQRR
ncbi:MAG: hypothetical protein JSR59_19405 [Proteobacteria bacterium]|nr:hypothetical protein [Pseudomonadota bacterium]